MKATIVYTGIVFLLLSVNLHGQRHWLEVKKTDQGINLSDRLGNGNHELEASSEIINFHETTILTQPIKLELSKSSFAQCQLFSVFQPKRNSSEGQIWKLSSKESDLLINTDQRTADLTNGKFINFVNTSAEKSRINSYQHYRSDFAADYLTIGGTPLNSQIPVQSFEGSLAEVITFDRVLAPIAKQAVESYLAIKYSIPLATGLDYVDANGNIYWNYHKNRNYAHRVAGLGRYNTLQLHQKQTQSEFGNGTITMSVGDINRLNRENKNELPDQSYLLWSDNDAEIDFNKENGKPATLLRKWKVNNYGSTFDDNLKFRLEHDGLREELESDLYYWLAWSSDEELSIENTNYTLLDNTKQSFNSNPLESPTSDISYFTIIKALALFVAIDMKEVSCTEDQLGGISFKAIGGLAPYEVTLSNGSEELVYAGSLESKQIVTVNDLKAGQYTLQLTDKSGLQFTKTFFINSAISRPIDLPNKIIATSGEESLDLIETADYDYLWTTPSGEQVEGSTIAFHESGNFTLQYGTLECKSWHTIKVLKLDNNISNTTVSPNPSTDGFFRYEALLKKSAPYTISISNSDGIEWLRKQFPAAKYIVYEDWIPKNGSYFITLTTDGESQSKQLVVIR